MLRGTKLATMLALAIACGSFARAQAVIKSVRSGTFVAYGLDAVKLRLLHAAIVRNPAKLPAPMRENPSGQPIGENTGYVSLDFEARNDGTIPENIPLLQATLEIARGATIDPAVYGPFVGASSAEAPTSTTIAPHRTMRLRLFVGDVPHDRRVEAVVLNPNDATAAYRFDVRARDNAPLR